MNTIYFKKVSIILLINLGFLSLHVLAGQDGSQRLLLDQIIKQQQKAKAIEAAKQHAYISNAEKCNKELHFGIDKKAS